MDGWQSPLMKIWFRNTNITSGRYQYNKWHFFLPDGEAFRTHGEALLLAEEEKRQQREAAEAKLAEMAAKLRALGLNPDDML
jgi:hypothetical protein